MSKATGKHWDDDDLAEAFNQRRDDALEEVFLRQFQDRVYFARRFVAPRDIAEDIVQDVFIKLFQERSHQFESLEHLDNSTYLWVYRRCLDYKRGVKRINAKLEDLRKRMDPEEADNIELQMIQTELIGHLMREIAKLSPRQKDVMELVQEGLTTEEIAQRLKISRQAVDSYRKTSFTILKGRLSDPAYSLLLLLCSESLIGIREHCHTLL